jgi:signal transduction histidine kinase
MLGDVWLVIATGLVAFSFSLVLLLSMPLAGDLQTLFQAHHELVVVLALPVIAQVGAAFLLIAGASGAGRMQQILVDWRMAYAREREVDQMREEFIASINHELRNPIMAVQNYLMLASLLGERGDAAAQQQMIQRGTEVADHLSGLMESIMSIRRLHMAQKDVPLVPITLLAMAERTTNMVRLLDGNGPHQMQIAIDPALKVAGDEGLLAETLSNLLTNATKYAPPATTITLAAQRIAPRELARLRPQFEAARECSYVDVTVRDEGIGIPADKAPLIFEPFVRLGRDETSSVIGSGMGLAIVRSNVTAMHGDVWVDSDGITGQGATFHIILGVAEAGMPMASTPTQKRRSVLENDVSGSDA